MKLLHCKSCFDIVALCSEDRACLCGKSSGYYKDKLNAVVKGPCMVLGISNPSFIEATARQMYSGDKEDGQGREFTAFIIPTNCSSVEHDNDD